MPPRHDVPGWRQYRPMRSEQRPDSGGHGNPGPDPDHDAGGRYDAHPDPDRDPECGLRHWANQRQRRLHQPQRLNHLHRRKDRAGRLRLSGRHHAQRRRQEFSMCGRHRAEGLSRRHIRPELCPGCALRSPNPDRYAGQVRGKGHSVLRRNGGPRLGDLFLPVRLAGRGRRLHPHVMQRRRHARRSMPLQ